MTEIFSQTLKRHGTHLNRSNLKVLQVNMGKLCNLTCLHCHVEAGPSRKEIMNEKTIDRLTYLTSQTSGIETVDLTGGAPELNPWFRKFVKEIRNLGKEVIVRSNLTVLFEKGQEETPQFFKENKLTVVASLPCYSKANVEKQRGQGVFDKSIDALKILNNLGYGIEGTDLNLHLVYNPLGAHLPPTQNKLELDYKRELDELFGIKFNKLLTITNMPIRRYLSNLKRQGKEEFYMNMLIDNFNLQALEQVMCRELVSVAYNGDLYDCDFNQMLEMPLSGLKKNIWYIEDFKFLADGLDISVGNHCYGSTAGAGSSCSGSLAV